MNTVDLKGQLSFVSRHGRWRAEGSGTWNDEYDWDLLPISENISDLLRNPSLEATETSGVTTALRVAGTNPKLGQMSVYQAAGQRENTVRHVPEDAPRHSGLT